MNSFEFVDCDTKGLSARNYENAHIYGTCIITNDEIKSINTNNVLQFADTFAKKGGSYSVILKYEKELLLISDCVGSIPVFYFVGENDIYVSLNALCIAKKINLKLDDFAVEEFLCTGYVTGEKKLFDNILQVSPGQVVSINMINGNISKKRYYNLVYLCDSKLPIKSLIKCYDEILINIYERLIERISDRIALIPLSGGCDSRTVSVMLKKLGYKRIVCFSYGTPNSMEVSTAKSIADNLGVQWYYIEYDSNKWRDLFTSNTYKDFLYFACKGNGIGCIQALPAILELSKKIDVKDAVVIPGHAEDYICGGHLPLLDEDEYFCADFIENIGNSHYRLNRSRNSVLRNCDWCKDIPDKLSRNDFIKLLFAWEWINRQSKFIANDVRSYEYVGYSWEIPFWDERNLEFWCHVPYEFLYGRKLQYLHMEKFIDPYAGIKKKYHVNRKKYEEKMKGLIRKKIPFVMDIYHNLTMENKYLNHPYAFFSHMDAESIKGYREKFGSDFPIHSIVAEDTINLYKGDFVQI